MSSALPLFPRIVFTILEPISLIAGFAAPFLNPSFFVSSQIAAEPPHPLYPSEHVLALQLGNLYLLLALLGLFILNTTTELKTVKAYLAALWIADIGHVAVTAWAMGWEGCVDVGAWNAMAWGNVGATVFLFTTRTLYFAGAFGEDKPVAAGKKKEL